MYMCNYGGKEHRCSLALTSVVFLDSSGIHEFAGHAYCVPGT